MLSISILVVILFSSVAYLFVSEKRVEMAQDIYFNTLSFAKLTSPEIVNLYDLYLADNGFVYFNRDFKALIEQNSDISQVQVVNFGGEVVYDSLKDVEKKYDGSERLVDGKFERAVKSENISFRTKDGNEFFVKGAAGNHYLDYYEKEVAGPAAGSLVDYFVVPTSEKYSVIYFLSYDSYNERINEMEMRIVYLAALGVMLGMVMSWLLSRQITKPVATLVGAAEKISAGDFSVRVDIPTSDEINLLGTSFNKMAEGLAKGMEARFYQERVTRELELAKSIQDQIVPDDAPPIKGLDISAGLRPASEIGGDMYDFLPLDENRTLMYLGDVTGHGVPAGIVSSIASALFCGFSGVSQDLKKTMIDVNRVLKKKTMPNIFMTLCLMEWDVLARSFNYVSAGHEQIIHYKAADKKAQLLPAGGIALGMVPDISKLISIESLKPSVGDVIVLYSDGIPECWRNADETYGVERLVNFVTDIGATGNADQIRDAILTDVDKFAAGYPQKDDITIIVIRVVD